MKILLVSHFFPPDRTAGAEKRTLGYALELQKLGHAVQVVCAGDWDIGGKHWRGYSDEVVQQVPVRRVHLNWSAAPDPNRYLYDNPVVENHFEKWLDEWTPDLVHIISLITLSIGVIRVAKRKGLPVVFTLTDFWLVCPKISLVRGSGDLCDGVTTSWECLQCLMWNSKMYRGIEKLFPPQAAATALEWISRRPALTRLRGLRGVALDMRDRKKSIASAVQPVDCFTAPSAFLGSMVQKSGILPQQVRVIHSGHDLSGLSALPKQNSAGVMRFGYIGQIIPVKGLHLLVQAFNELVKENPAVLWIYGDDAVDPAYTRSLKSLVGAAPVHWMGPFPHSQLGEVLSGVDVLVVPSQWHENNPRVIQEAFATHTPVIASNVGGISEFVRHGVDGLLFEHSSAPDLQAQMQRLVVEPRLLEQLQAGIQPVKTNADEMKELVAIYHSLLGQMHNG